MFPLLLASLTLSLNLILILTVRCRKRCLQTVELYIVNMAVCDLLHGILGYPLLVYSMFAHVWPLGITSKAIFEESCVN